MLIGNNVKKIKIESSNFYKKIPMWKIVWKIEVFILSNSFAKNIFKAKIWYTRLKFLKALNMCLKYFLYRLDTLKRNEVHNVRETNFQDFHPPPSSVFMTGWKIRTVLIFSACCLWGLKFLVQSYFVIKCIILIRFNCFQFYMFN